VAGALFLDIAGVSGSSGGSRASAGVEIVLSHALLFEGLDRVRGGIALPVLEGDGVSVYIRSGWAF
jgi:hypothetical protein